jgi:hypothetical protein
MYHNRGWKKMYKQHQKWDLAVNNGRVVGGHVSNKT